MKKNFKIQLIIFITVIVLSSCETINTLLNDLNGNNHGFTNEEAIVAMKDALLEGTQTASAELNKKDGYLKNEAIKILFPPEAQIIVDNIGKIPGGQMLLNTVIKTINKSAEEAAKDLVPIFSKAITDMTVKDGVEIILGDANAATTYLKNKTHKQLFDLYKPKMEKCLDTPLIAGVSANTAWKNLAEAYNRAGSIPNRMAKLQGQPQPMPEVNADLPTFTTEKAIDGVFYKIGEEEIKIRKNPLDYASTMIQKVFGAVLKN